MKMSDSLIVPRKHIPAIFALLPYVARLTISLLVVGLLAPEVIAAPLSQPALAPTAKQFVPPPTRSPVGTSSYGASRNTNCGWIEDIPFTPLVLTSESQPITMDAPTFFWISPNDPPHTFLVMLSTTDDAGEKVFLHQHLYVEESTGLVSFTLPPDPTVELLPEQPYLWEVVLACSQNGQIRPDDAVISAWVHIEPRSPDLLDALEQAQTPQDTAETYADAGYWYDALRRAFVHAMPSVSASTTPSNMPSNNFENPASVISLLQYLAASEGNTDQGELFRQIANQLEPTN